MPTATTRRTKRSENGWDFSPPKVLEIPPEAHTYNGFLDWVMSDDFPEKMRVWYLQGTVSVDMSEESIPTHVAVKGGIYRTLLSLAEEIDFGQFYTDGVLYCNRPARISGNPDGVAARWEAFENGRVRFIVRKDLQRALEGSPDWIMEIVSDSSVGKDKKKLRAAYHRAHIEEYWIIDARGDDIDFQILTWRPAGYVSVPSKDGWTYSKIFGRSFRLTRRKNRIGIWTYRLEIKPGENKTQPST